MPGPLPTRSGCPKGRELRGAVLYSLCSSFSVSASYTYEAPDLFCEASSLHRGWAECTQSFKVRGPPGHSHLTLLIFLQACQCGENTSSESQPESLLHHSLACCANLGKVFFSTCKLEIIIVPTSQGCCEDKKIVPGTLEVPCKCGKWIHRMRLTVLSILVITW